MKLPAVFAILLCLSGCTKTISPTIKKFNTLQPGAIQTKKVGEALFEKGTSAVLPGFMAQRSSDLPLMGHILFPPVKIGDTWTCNMTLESNYLCFNSRLKLDDVHANLDEKQPGGLPLFILDREGAFRGLYFPTKGYTYTLDALEALTLKGLFKRVEVPQDGSFRQELIYSGKKDDSIRFVYREFREDLSKPSLFKALNFSLSTLDVIQLDDVIIEVIEATESSIKYRIIITGGGTPSVINLMPSIPLAKMKYN